MAIAQLTSRERQILSLIACGKQNKEIAKELGLAVRTVEHHLTRIFSKLGVSNRTEAAVKAQRMTDLADPINYGNPQ